ncbi:MAG: hypothetical protein E6H74_06685 [Betaproteobacteria bacterium]|nr:MAG: hypothetical protein E6H74_06685 [Betaproteobacteria bacterium]
MERVVVNISELDQLVRDELDSVESAKDFGVALWRQERDENGANWDAHIKRLRGKGSPDGTWRDVVPKLRAAFNLDDESE